MGSARSFAAAAASTSSSAAGDYELTGRARERAQLLERLLRLELPLEPTMTTGLAGPRPKVDNRPRLWDNPPQRRRRFAAALSLAGVSAGYRRSRQSVRAATMAALVAITVTRGSRIGPASSGQSEAPRSLGASSGSSV